MDAVAAVHPFACGSFRVGADMLCLPQKMQPGADRLGRQIATDGIKAIRSPVAQQRIRRHAGSRGDILRPRAAVDRQVHDIAAKHPREPDHEVMGYRRLRMGGRIDQGWDDMLIDLPADQRIGHGQPISEPEEQALLLLAGCDGAGFAAEAPAAAMARGDHQPGANQMRAGQGFAIDWRYRNGSDSEGDEGDGFFGHGYVLLCRRAPSPPEAAGVVSAQLGSGCKW